MPEGEWSVDGTVFHTCGGSDGCMCVYDPECNPAIKRHLEVQEERAVALAAARMKAWANSHPWADTQGLRDDEWRGLARAALNLIADEER